MNKELIEKLALEAGLFVQPTSKAVRMGLDDEDVLMNFAALVAEECAKITEARAADYEEYALHEETADLQERCRVYAKHIRRAAVDIRKAFKLEGQEP